MKYGILIPTSVKHAIELDLKNEKQDAIKIEMENNKVAFELLDHHKKPPPCYKHIWCHMNFEVKIEEGTIRCSRPHDRPLYLYYLLDGCEKGLC